MRLIRCLCFSLLIVALPTLCGATIPDARAPDVLVHETTDRILNLIKSDPAVAAGDKKRIAELVDTELLDHFDFVAMTRLATGKDWRNVDEAKRPTLVREFQTLLVRTYSTALSQYHDQVIEYKTLSLEPGSKNALVQTTISQHRGNAISMNYRLAASPSGWKVYDVIVEGVSLVVNYRSLFNSTVESSGIDGLIQLLRDKNKVTS